MTRLISKWASDDALVSAALEQDKKAKPDAGSSNPPITPIAPPKTTKLVSKWADAPDPTPHTKHSPKKTNTQLMTPPSSAGNGGRRDRRKSEGKSDRGSFGQGTERRNSRGNGHKPDSLTAEVSSTNKNPYADSGRSLASRLGSLDIASDHSGQRDSKPKKSHAGRGSRASRPTDKTGHHVSFGHENDDDENSRGPMTDAAKSFALRLGVPVKEPASSTSKHHNSQNDRHTTRRDSHGNGAYKNEKPASALSGSKYMTPKQKRALEEQEKRAKLTKEQELKEEKLKEEVKHMFEKMSDKSTSWADLEDESD